MRVEFLGTGGYHPNERRHTACVLLPDIGLAFDCGTSAFRLAPRVRTPELDVYLSHAHLDHIAGLTFLLVPLLQGTLSRVRVHANAKTLDAVREHLFADAVFPMMPEFEFVTLQERHAVAGGGTLTWIPLKHPGGSTGFRIDWPGRSLAYITDTTADGSYTDFVRGVDVLMHECYFPDELAEWAPKTGHSHTTPVAQLARAAGVGRLFLVHVDPQRPDDDPVDLARARSIFAATELAEDLMEIEV